MIFVKQVIFMGLIFDNILVTYAAMTVSWLISIFSLSFKRKNIIIIYF